MVLFVQRASRRSPATGTTVKQVVYDQMAQLLGSRLYPETFFGLALPQASTREEAARWVEVLKVLQTMEEEESKVRFTECRFHPCIPTPLFSWGI